MNIQLFESDMCEVLVLAYDFGFNCSRIHTHVLGVGNHNEVVFEW